MNTYDFSPFFFTKRLYIFLPKNGNYNKITK